MTCNGKPGVAGIVMGTRKTNVCNSGRCPGCSVCHPEDCRHCKGTLMLPNFNDSPLNYGRGFPCPGYEDEKR